MEEVKRAVIITYTTFDTFDSQSSSVNRRFIFVNLHL
jgi:hypothetical protein